MDHRNIQLQKLIIKSTVARKTVTLPFTTDGYTQNNIYNKKRKTHKIGNMLQISMP